MSTVGPPAAPSADSRRLLPWLVAVAFFMQTLDATIVNTALPAMARSLGESPLHMQSVVVAYMLTVALLIPASGWLSDKAGTRRVFIAAIVLFSLGSLMCAASRTLTMLVAARVLQGLGGALLLPVGRLAILRSYDKAERLRALTFVSVPGLVGPLLGPTVGGWLVEVASWHWIFLINLPVGVIGVIAARRWMPEFRSAVPPRFDLQGFVLFSAGLVMVSLGLQGFGEGALSLAATMLLVVAGLAAMAGYWLHAARVPAPLFSVQLFAIPTFSIGLLGNLFSRLGSGAMPFLMPLFLQVGLGFSPSSAGVSMVPIAAGALLCKTFAVPLIDRLGYRTVLVGNTVALGLMIASFGFISATTPHALTLLLLGLFGVVNSLQFTAMNTLTLGDLEGPLASGGNSLLSVVMQLSMSLGVAAGGALLAAFTGGHAGAPPREIVQAFHLTFFCIGSLSVVAACVFFQLGRKEAPRGTPEVADES